MSATMPNKSGVVSAVECIKLIPNEIFCCQGDFAEDAGSCQYILYSLKIRNHLFVRYLISYLDYAKSISV